MPQLNVATPSGSDRSEVRPMLKTSKQWVIPPRQKPGRKPSSASQSAKDGGESEGKKALNRASQRAFRERRQEYVTELEEKVRLLEQGQGEKAVFFQQQALKMRQEAAQLKEENTSLKKLVDALRRELSRFKSGESPGTQQPSPPNLQGETSKQSSPRYYSASSVAESPPKAYASPRYQAPVQSPRYIAASSPRYNASPAYSHTSPYASPYGGPPLSNVAVVPPPFVQPHSLAVPMPAPAPTPAAAPAPSSTKKKASGNPRCGFCTSETSCFCSEVGYEIDHSQTMEDESDTEPAHHETKKVVDMLQKAAVVADVEHVTALPLKRAKSTTTTTKKVWSFTYQDEAKQPPAAPGLPSPASLVSNAPSASDTKSDKPALCNGNPENCPACANDAFGKAFCNALGEEDDEEDEQASLEKQVEEEMSLLIDIPCCGNPEVCGSTSCAETQLNNKRKSEDEGDEEEVPCNEAWTQLKSHPNIAFADLRMLADVVSKHSHKKIKRESSFDAIIKREDSPDTIRSMTPLHHKKKRLTVNKHAVDEALQILDRGGF